MKHSSYRIDPFAYLISRSLFPDLPGEFHETGIDGSIAVHDNLMAGAPGEPTLDTLQRLYFQIDPRPE
ncbi:MAG: hypothetical protein ACRDHW_04360 [Ktedonobacteraceae bacterium]